MMLLTGARIHRPCKLYGAEDAMLRRRRPPSGVRKEVVGYSARLGPGLPYPGPYLLALIQRSAWKGYSPKSIYRIVHNAFPQVDELPPQATLRRAPNHNL